MNGQQFRDQRLEGLRVALTYASTDADSDALCERKSDHNAGSNGATVVESFRWTREYYKQTRRWEYCSAHPVMRIVDSIKSDC